MPSHFATDLTPLHVLPFITLSAVRSIYLMTPDFKPRPQAAPFESSSVVSSLYPSPASLSLLHPHTDFTVLHLWLVISPFLPLLLPPSSSHTAQVPICLCPCVSLSLTYIGATAFPQILHSV